VSEKMQQKISLVDTCSVIRYRVRTHVFTAVLLR